MVAFHGFCISFASSTVFQLHLRFKFLRLQERGEKNYNEIGREEKTTVKLVGRKKELLWNW